MSLFDGLYVYEVVLLVLGSLFFVALAASLITQILRGKTYMSLLLFFAIPIAMIGFPSIQKIQFQEGTVSIEKSTKQLESDPTNAALRSQLEQQVAKVSTRPSSDPRALVSVAKAQFALGNPSAAESTLQKALQKSPALPQAQELKQRIEIDRNLATLTAQLSKHPGDNAAKQKLQETVNEASRLKIASPVLLSHLASGKAALGDEAKAVALADTALKIDPNQVEAKRLKEQVRNAK